MNAKEMFEELGFELLRSPTSIEYKIPQGTLIIIFFKDTRQIRCDFMLDTKLLKAINQQCKELRWLDE